MNAENNDNDKNYCLISKEILLFIEWILLYDSRLLENFIKKIWNRGFEKICTEELEKQIKLNEFDGQQTILDFFTILDNTITKLNKKNNEEKYKKINEILNKDFAINLEQNELYQKIVEKSFLESTQEINDEKITKIKTYQTDDEKNNIKKNFYKNFLEKWNPNDIIIE